MCYHSPSTGDRPTIAGCLRNYAAVAKAAMTYGPRVAMIPAGERWHDEARTLRPAYEDWIGAGAIISQLNGRLSPEAARLVLPFWRSNLMKRWNSGCVNAALVKSI